MKRIMSAPGAHKKQKLLTYYNKPSYCSTLGNTVEVLESVRELPPLHSRFKVESFTKLSEMLKRMKIDYFESSRFSAGGFQWKLSVYPDGKRSDNGDDHISLYLKLVDQLTPDYMIHATIKFFVYDHLNDVYLTIHDVREKKFDAMNTEWGIPRLMTLTTFKDPDNGFLYNDSCVFGVELLFADENCRSMSSLSPLFQGYLMGIHNQYGWKVDNFSAFNGYPIFSPVFTLGGYGWTLRMDHLTIKGFLSVFLYPAQPTANMYVEFEICLKDDLFGKHIKTIASGWFPDQNTYCGCSKFVSLHDLNNPSYGYKFRDTVIIEVKILEIFVLKDMS